MVPAAGLATVRPSAATHSGGYGLVRAERRCTTADIRCIRTVCFVYVMYRWRRWVEEGQYVEKTRQCM